MSERGLPTEQPLQVVAIWDSDARVYVATSEDVPGLVAEAPTLDALSEKVLALVPELLELNGSPVLAGDAPSGRDVQLPIQMVTTKHVTLHA